MTDDTADTAATEAAVQTFQDNMRAIRGQLDRVIVGQDQVI